MEEFFRFPCKYEVEYHQIITPHVGELFQTRANLAITYYLKSSISK